MARTIIRAMRNALEIMMLPPSLFFGIRLSGPEFPFAPKTAAIVRSIPARVNVKQFATPGENISLTYTGQPRGAPTFRKTAAKGGAANFVVRQIKTETKLRIGQPASS